MLRDLLKRLLINSEAWEYWKKGISNCIYLLLSLIEGAVVGLIAFLPFMIIFGLFGQDLDEYMLDVSAIGAATYGIMHFGRMSSEEN